MGKTKIDRTHALATVVRHHIAGIPIKQTAYELGVSTSRVTQFRKSLGITRPRRIEWSEVLWLRVSLEMKHAMASARGSLSISGYIRNLIEADLAKSPRLARSEHASASHVPIGTDA